MRAGIPNPLTRERTITLYLHKPAFMQSLEMEDEEHIYILLLDKNHNEISRFRGMYSEEAGNNLFNIITKKLETGQTV
jgi:hypothetical protein